MDSEAEIFLSKKHLFGLGQLTTEMANPKTRLLESLSVKSPELAVELIKSADIESLTLSEPGLDMLTNLREDIKKCLSGGGKIFISGCGATGRLALNLEYLWRLENQGPMCERLISFMAGGDIALVHSLEGFEDHHFFGARHLMNLNFSENDLLIGVSEGGETPFVIGTVQQAKLISKYKPYFLFCNPKDQLCQLVERSRVVIDDSQIVSISLESGPMALSGSTRMQASTILMLGLGLALDSLQSTLNIKERWFDFKQHLQRTPYGLISQMTEFESGSYQNNRRIVYLADHLALPVFTDTTERAPTFSLSAFSPIESTDQRSLSYVNILDASSKKRAWEKLLLREPRVLNWAPEETSRKYLESFDFSQDASQSYFKKYEVEKIQINQIGGHQIEFIFNNKSIQFVISSKLASPLFLHLTTKVLMNAHSTVLMGRLGRYRENIMTWVKASNGKLIDRAARYLIQLANSQGVKNLTYEQAIHAIFKAKQSNQIGQPIVLEALKEVVESNSIRAS